MCLKDIIHQRRWSIRRTGVASGVNVNTQLVKEDPRRIAITVTSSLSASFAAGEYTWIGFGVPGNWYPVAIFDMYNHVYVFKLSEWGSELFSSMMSLSNHAVVGDSIGIAELLTNEDDYSLTHNP